MPGRPPPERLTLLVLVLAVAVLTATALVWPQFLPTSALVLPVMVAAWRLSPRGVVVLAAFVAVSLAVQLARLPVGRTVWSTVVVVLSVLLAHRYASLRQRAGLAPGLGLDILLELRDGLHSLGELPTQPEGWTVVRALRTARDVGMSGDFTLAHSSAGVLQVVLVDVGGHGPGVAARASQLSGAFGGLLGAVPPERLLPCCNDYLLGRGWRETFATAVHLAVDLASGQARVWSAGHPPARLRSADGSWRPAPSSGPLLGLVDAPAFTSAELQLETGDTVVLLSDGLLDEAEQIAHPVRVAVDAWAGEPRTDAHEPLLAAMPPAGRDDQSLMLVRRDA